MTSLNKHRILAAAALAGILLIPSTPGSAQVRVNQDGRAADANNRVGSNGYNEQGSFGQIGITPNQVVYGNVTGGREFRGPIFERDSRAFSGVIPGVAIDRFIAGSSGVPEPYQPAFNLSSPQPFYGQSRAVEPPEGTLRVGFTGDYLGTQFTSRWNEGYSGLYNAGLTYQSPLGQSIPLEGVGTRTTLVPQPGETVLQGQLETSNQQAMISGSPLYGVRLLQPGDLNPADTTGLPQPGKSGVFSTNSDRFRVPQFDLQRMRSELQNPANQSQSSDQGNPQPTPSGINELNGSNQGGTNGQRGQSSALPRSDLSQPPEAPINTAINPNASIALNPSLSNGTNTGQFVQQRVTSLVSPRLQSAQYDELQRRYEKYQNPQVSQLESAMQFRRDQARLAQASTATSRPSVAANQGLNVKPLPPTPVKPLEVASLATGIKAKGLHDLLSGAEDLMRQEKFQSAIDKYNTAEQVAPNNGLVPLGRANAELGAGYYRLASADLHRVFLADPPLLMGRYDLNAWIPKQRLDFIRKELKDLAQSDSKQEMPAFLLAYISYNTGDSPNASKYLKEALDRSGSTNGDPLLEILQLRWDLSEKSPATQPNPEDSKATEQPDLNK